MDAPKDERYGDVLFAKGRVDEAERLTVLAAAYDPASHQRLSALGVGDGWRCLDVGAGSGLVAAWMAAQGANVTAMDRDVSLLRAPASKAGFRVLEADLLDERLDPGRYDLVHARYVLMHLPQAQDALPRLASWVKPGGWLVLSDSIDSTPESSQDSRWARVMAGLWHTLRVTIGSDISWVRDYPALLRRAGLVRVGAEVFLPSADADSPAATLWRMNLAQMRERIAAHSDVTEADVNDVIAALTNDGFHELAPGMITAWGRRPQA